ncbi:MAG: 1-(5-phosphoribosyl)-5-[(5-phosphoribosylamino)methylideneamino]imidazole-4-carboxamide isomerase [Sphingobacteriaceae bacterium]|nr:1-(5-phosphoribosyl)-5-[(5-phosphoribosylamino)methylideneamino]imidazole-4-carboxamide isomerase [Sphingobacteriaceae bacterium]
MKKFEIIPAIDVIDGKCVRLSQGDYSKKTIYNEDPLEVAKQFEAIGISRLHLVDLDGAKKGEVVNFKVLDKIANQTDLKIDFGGGIKTNASIQSIFDAGADMATIGSVAVKDPELFYTWIKKYGSPKILLGADVKEEKIAISGWIESTELNIFDFLKQNIENGLTQAFCTDVSKDGMLAGSSIDLYKKILEKFTKLNFVASGGVVDMNEVYTIRNMGCSGVIIGKALYEGRISTNDLKLFIKDAL